MAQFEIHEQGVIWTNGDIGALLENCESRWKPFRYFNNGNLDICEYEFNTPAKAFERAIDYFS